MPNRDELHRLVDSLPEEALAPVERALRRYQIWPPEVPPDAMRLQERVKDLLAERTAGRPSCVYFSSYRVSSNGEGDWTAHARGSTNDSTLVSIEIRGFHGHDVQIERQLSVSEEKGKLTYAFSIKGPDGKEDRREFEFDVGEA
jgi:hypothetical protein